MDKPNDQPKQLPPISALDDSGVLWEFSPTEERWTVHVDGKKSYSKDYQKLFEKVSKLTEAKTSKVIPLPVAENHHSPQEFAMMSKSMQAYTGGSPVFLPIVVRTEWNAVKGVHEVIRFKKIHGKEESGWLSSGASSLHLIHPHFLSQEDKNYLEKAILFDLVSSKANSLWGKISSAWWACKDHSSVVMEESYQHGLIVSKGVDSMSRRQAFISENWPYLSRPDAASPTWQSQDDGSYRAGSVSVRMSLKDKTHYSPPTFEVFCDRWPEPVFSGDFKFAMQIADATSRIVQNSPQVNNEWRSPVSWGTSKSSTVVWPSLFEVHGGAILKGQDRYDQSSISGWSLCQPVKHALSASPRALHSGGQETPALQWRPTQDISGGVVFASCGPEDQLLPKIKALLSEVESFLSDQDLASVKTRLTSSPLDYVFSIKPPASDALSEVIAKLEEEGEDSSIAKTRQQIQIQFDHVYNRIKTQVQRSELFVLWEKNVDARYEEIISLLPAIPQLKASHKGPVPS